MSFLFAKSTSTKKPLIAIVCIHWKILSQTFIYILKLQSENLVKTVKKKLPNATQISNKTSSGCFIWKSLVFLYVLSFETPFTVRDFFFVSLFSYSKSIQPLAILTVWVLDITHLPFLSPSTLASTDIKKWGVNWDWTMLYKMLKTHLV